MRIRLYLRKYEKALGIQCFLLYTGIVRRQEEGVYEFELTMDYIHGTRHCYFTNFICDLWSVFIFHLSEVVTKPKEK